MTVDGACFATEGSSPVSAFARVKPTKLCAGSPFTTADCSAAFGVDLLASTDASGPPEDAKYQLLWVQIGTYGQTSFSASDAPYPTANASYVMLGGEECNTTSPGGPGASHSFCSGAGGIPGWASASGSVSCENDAAHVACHFQGLTVTDGAGNSSTASGFIHATFSP